MPRLITGPHYTINPDDSLDSAREDVVHLALTLAHGIQAFTSDENTNMNGFLETWVPSWVRLPPSDNTRIGKTILSESFRCVCKLAGLKNIIPEVVVYAEL